MKKYVLANLLQRIRKRGIPFLMKCDFSSVIGAIKPMHAVNNMPILGADDKMFHYAGEAAIPYARLHDTGGAYGQNRFVDISNIFRDFDADENNPASYDFAFTDWLLEAMQRQSVKPFYRLGVTIENAQHIKAYYIYPPKDNAKWARICEHIIAHYNEGWADGYHMGIEYWEIWNEPDNFPDIKDTCMWKGTFEQYLALYEAASVHLKNRFPYIKIGGYASCGFYSIFDNNFVGSANSSSRTGYFIECFHKFMQFVKEKKLPLDFFSWHSYSDVAKNIAYENYVHENLRAYGFEHVESILNEWNTGIAKRGTLEDSSDVAEMMLAMQDTTVSMLMYYDGQVHGSYQGLYNPISYTPFKTYYTFKAFSALYALKHQISVTDKPEGVACVGAADGKRAALMLTNKGAPREVPIFLTGQTSPSAFRVYRIGETDDLSPVCKLTPDADGKISLPLATFETVLLCSDKGI